MNTETIKTIASAVAIIVVNIANWAGYALDADMMVQMIMSVVALVALGWGIWKNHNFTAAAQEAQAYLDLIKDRDGVDRSDEEEAKG